MLLAMEKADMLAPVAIPDRGLPIAPDPKSGALPTAAPSRVAAAPPPAKKAALASPSNALSSPVSRTFWFAISQFMPHKGTRTCGKGVRRCPRLAPTTGQDTQGGDYRDLA